MAQTSDHEPDTAGPGPSRRSFLTWSGVAAGAATLVATTTRPEAEAGAVEGDPRAERTVWSACTVNCGSRCPVRLQVRDGTITRVLPDNTGDDRLGSQQVRACVRGRSIRHRIYNPDRLLKPLKRRAGTKRGEDEYDEISWETAFSEIAQKMKAIKAEYGNEAFYINYGTGVLGATMACSWPPDNTAFARLMNCWGGYLDHYSDYSSTEITQAYPYFYGTWIGSNSFDDARHAQLQVMFGNNPLETRMSGGGQTFVTQQTKRETSLRTIVVDPRYSETSVALGDDWIPVRPGTDAALIAGMIHEILARNMQDQAFLDRYCVGFDEATLPEGAPANSSYRAYIEGTGPDGVEKTPEWAQSICGTPAERIRQFAREVASAKPCAITQGWGPQRHANGENEARAIFLLACVTGNVGIPGGGNGGREDGQALPFKQTFNTNTTNPVEKIISVFSWLDAIEHGPRMNTFNAGVGVKPEPRVRVIKPPVDDAGNPENTQLTVPIKMVWQYGGNSVVNQTGDNNQSARILEDDTACELIVVCDIQKTVSTRYADYILPGTSTAEEFDLHPGENAGAMAYGIMSSQAIEPLGECKSIYDICQGLAKALGPEIEQLYTEGKTREQWLREIVDLTRQEDPDLPDYDRWVDMGLYRKDMGPVVSMEDFRSDPVANPLETPSGKIEIYSQRLARMSQAWTFGDFRPKLAGDVLTPLPEYVETWEGQREARDSKAYPLQIIGHHFKARTHSSYGNVDWLQEAHHQTCWINPADARARGISNGDQVFVFNDRGTGRTEAKVTTRIAPGVLSLPQGAWYDPRPAGEFTLPAGANPDQPVDVGGCINSLTSLHPSPLAKGNAVHTTIVEIAKA